MISFTRLKAVMKKEFIHVFRDTRSLGFALFMPLLLLNLYGFALTLDVNNIKIAVFDQDKSELSRDLLERFVASGYFNIISYTDNYKEIDSLFSRSKCNMAICIPCGFSRDVEADKPNISVQILLDGTDANMASVSMGYATSIIRDFNVKIVSDYVNQKGLGQLKNPLDARVRVWYNPELKSRNFIIPGLIALIMGIMAVMLTSLVISKEWENGTMEMLISTPIKPVEIIFGKLIPYFIIGLFDVLIIILAGNYVFHVPFRGSYFLLMFAVVVFLLGVLTWGIMISSITKNQLLSTQMAFMTTFIPLMLLSGFIFDIKSMPKIIQIITYIIPARYFISALKGIYLKGVGLHIIWPEIMLLIIFTIVIVFFTTTKFKKKL